MSPFSAIFVPDSLAAALTDEAWLAAALRAEQALVTAEAEAGIVGEDAADAVVRACRSLPVDVPRLVEEGRRAGNPVEPLVRLLREHVGDDYAADVHRLERVRRGATARQIARYLPTQGWYGKAAAMFLITAVIPRTQWKYRFPRAYKVILAEAGHLCQNICLTATWLGLAPFCTMALADSAIERDLGIDGVNEAIVYAAGVGTRPEGVEWAPSPTGRRVTRTRGPFAR